MANQPVTDKLQHEIDRATCRNCGKSLPIDAQFCGVCGAPSSVAGPHTCASCGQANPGDARFCSRCGAALATAAAASAPPAAPPAAAGGGPAWGQVALGGLGGLVVGSLLGGGRGGWGGFGGGDADDYNGGWDSDSDSDSGGGGGSDGGD